ncbi:MAG TPA: AMP-binding protein [Solirubrobacterales bacterium]|nr:AMP-binding protein [Solirubrobacterales bacterium]
MGARGRTGGRASSASGRAAQAEASARTCACRPARLLQGEGAWAGNCGWRSPGAPLPREVAEFFAALGILVVEGYGLTECTTVATVNRPDRYRFGTVGPAVPGVELRIAEDGEILVRGDTVFRGYWRNEEATQVVLGADGWLRTGDVGSIDADGFLSITDRKKDLIVTPGGENVSAQNIENALKASRYISQALVVGDRRPYLAALITVDQEEAEKAARNADQLQLRACAIFCVCVVCLGVVGDAVSEVDA